MARTYLVTGGTGALGSAVVKALLASGARVRTLDHSARLADLAHEVERHVGDIRDPEAVQRAVQGVDGVCHLADIDGAAHFYSRPDLILDVGVKGMLNIVDACVKHNVGELFVASSAEVYQIPPCVPTDEGVPLIVPDVHNPRYSHAGAKIISELLTINYGRKHFQRAVVFRTHNVYGPDMGWQDAIPQLAIRVRDLAEAHPTGRLRVPIQGSGRETRSFIHVEDAAAAILRVVHHGVHLGVYNVGTTEEITIERLVREIAAILEREAEVEPGPLRPGSTPRRCPDIGKLRGLGFVPSIPLQEGLAQTVAWYLAQPGSHAAA